MRKKKSYTKKLELSAETVPTFQTDRELMEYLFITEILKLKYPQKITDKTVLLDFVPKEHKAFSDDYIRMYLDMANIKFGQGLSHLKKKPVKEIIDYMTKKRAWGRR